MSVALEPPHWQSLIFILNMSDMEKPASDVERAAYLEEKSHLITAKAN